MGDNAYDGSDISQKNLVQNQHCECNYDFSGDWSQWVDKWINTGGLLHGSQGPSWGMDLSMCWTNNPRDMIYLQNQLWWNRNKWSNQRLPIASYGSGPQGDRPY